MTDFARERNEQSGSSVSECLYKLADNQKFVSTASQIQEQEKLYHHLRETVPKSNVSESTYMVAGYKNRDIESVYFHGMNDPYDHLRETYRTRHNDDTYDYIDVTTPGLTMKWLRKKQK